ncbi:trans-sulfuration enzyme family protein [Ideonella livida]|uniref:Aminotransferase class I/II-fold pyridoxal phosphate-dependent enzyme n=1 Tax=Ideonella livida TaxID=2707176 RepID=A0A7C9TNI6_9BURK|nr:aminotransferase class I/II-fold pyridoxal phosphate-dependent enzyme [Ideonella livida]NDY93307.1 aminotransferase class I/II-fold pyridoxal phosphate-dependent enzyme [Ideonella livida]
MPAEDFATPATPALHPATLALHAALRPDPGTRSLQPVLDASVNQGFDPGSAAFSADGVDDLAALPFLYARWGNPTVRQLEQRLAAVEGGEDALCTASGVAAVAATCLGLLRAGDHLIVSDVCYAGAHELMRKLLPDFGIQVSAVNLSDLDAVRAALRPETRLIHAESPCNPLLRLTDLGALAELAHAHGALLSVDSTLATPVMSRPLSLGADLVIHSLTKFINGHGDALGGCVIGARALVARLRGRAGVYLGACLSAQAAWLIQRGLDTLGARLAQASRSAAALAHWLQGHPAVSAVTYPGLPSHPQHALACRQMPGGFGAVLTFQTPQPEAMARQLAQRLRLVHYAFSLGHQRSLVVLLGTDDMMRSYALPPAGLAEYRRYAGDGVFRLSVGLEALPDLQADLDQALRA